MPKMKLTDRGVRALPTPAKGQVEYWDESLPAFGVRVSYRGRRSFVVLVRVNGHKQRVTIGPYPIVPLGAARDKAIQAMRLAREGMDPAAEKKARRGAPTVAELADTYLQEYARKHKRSWKNDAVLIERYIKKELGSIRVTDLTRAKVRDMLRPIADRTGVQANRCLEVIRRIFSWAIAEDKVSIAANPASGIGKLTKEEKRDRVLRTDEIKALWDATETVPVWARAAVRLMLLTGQREGEVLGLDSAELDGVWWELPAERSKNGQAHRTYLCPLSRQIIAELTEGRVGRVFGRSRTALAKHWEKIKVRASIEDVRMHDLRRTTASQLAELGVGRFIVQRVLNHVDRQVTGTYDRYGYSKEKIGAMTQWEARLSEIVGQPPIPLNVIRLAANA
jgi:integrase